jgi:hypothetical protein
LARTQPAEHYDGEFYSDIRDGSLRSARRVLAILRTLLGAQGVASVVDVGCGEGSWLAAAREAFAPSDLLGIDGAHVLEAASLRIPHDRFAPHDLAAAPGTLPPAAALRRWDLCMSLEVAEHLPAAAADAFVGSLCGLAPLILFSAAVPRQGGTLHVNEQWPGYWVERFAARGFAPIDAIRPRVWGDAEVKYWYQQNVLLFADRDAAARPALRALAEETAARGVPALVHPELFLREAEAADALRRRWLVRGANLLRRVAGRAAAAIPWRSSPSPRSGPRP